MAKKKNAGGRKPLWDILDMDDKLEAVEGWALQGSLDAEIMEMLGVGKDTFYKWKKEKPEFAEALKKGRHISNGELINAAYRQAMGYKTVELKREMAWAVDKHGNKLLDEDGKPYMKMTVTEEKIKEVHPNTTMLIFLLKNRLPSDFRDKQHIEHTGAVGTTDMSHLNDDELEQAIKKLKGD